MADGAGGMDAGEIASRYATERTVHHYLQAVGKEWGERLLAAMYAANDDLRELGAKRDKNSRMATTMVATVIQDNVAYVANVGDSRAYIFREGDLEQITKDQSLVVKLVDEGIITAAEAEVHPRKNVILYSLGSEREPRIDLYRRSLKQGDRLLLCSDGLTRHVSDREMKSVLAEEEPQAAARILVDLANERGGQDNISVGVLEFSSVPGAQTEEDAQHIALNDPQPVVVASSGPERIEVSRRYLWLYTALLAVVQTILIFLVWFLYAF